MEVHRSARKHGVDDEDIRQAGGHFVVANRIDDVEPLRELRLGFDTAGRLMEVVVLVLDDGRELAIHAMRADRNTSTCCREPRGGDDDEYAARDLEGSAGDRRGHREPRRRGRRGMTCPR